MAAKTPPAFTQIEKPEIRKSPLVYNMRVLSPEGQARIMRPFGSESPDNRPFLAGHEEDEYNKNVMYTDYLWDNVNRRGDPTLMARLLAALEFRRETDPEPFRIVLGTVHRNLQSIGATQSLLKLMSAMSKMARLDAEVANQKESNDLGAIPNAKDFVLLEEVPEDVDLVADIGMGITAKHRRMWTFRDVLKKVDPLTNEQKRLVSPSFPKWPAQMVVDDVQPSYQAARPD